jgi:predicted TIM-barrel fold metal-dependent hydrolase
VLSGESIRIVDAHHHLWDLSGGWYPWLEGGRDAAFFLGDVTALRRNYLPADYRMDAFAFTVEASVHVEAECERSLALEETRWLHTLHEAHGMPHAVVAHAWLHDPGLEEKLESHSQFRLVRGLRSKPLTRNAPDAPELSGPGTLQDPQWREGLRRLAARDWSWDLRVPFWHLAEAAQVLESVPELRVALNHVGLPWDRSHDGLRIWRAGMRQLAALPRVVCKLSELGLPHEAWTIASNRRIVCEALEIFSPERCLFGSNYPVAGLRVGFSTQILGMLNMIRGVSPAEQDAILRANALRFYRIQPADTAPLTSIS